MPTIVMSMFRSLILHRGLCNSAKKWSYYVNLPNKGFHCRYQWNFSSIPLKKRLDFFESNWAFFTGFGNVFYFTGSLATLINRKLNAGFVWFTGSPCVLAIFFLSPLVSGALMAILFPLVNDLCLVNNAIPDILFNMSDQL